MQKSDSSFYILDSGFSILNFLFSMATLKQIEANRRNSQLSTGPTSQAGKAVCRMNALKTGIDAQSQIITGEDPEALERLTTQYYDRYEPQGPEEISLIDDAVSSDWLLRRLRKTEAQIWDRSSTEHTANLFKWGQKPEKFPLAAAFLDEQKAFERLQRRISAVERSLRAALETLARLRKVGQALSPGNPAEVGQAILSPAKNAAQPSPEPLSSPSKETINSEIGSVPETSPAGHALPPANAAEAAESPAPDPQPLIPDPRSPTPILRIL
jgi:hypothetical protein